MGGPRFHSSLSCTQEGCDDPGIAATVEHSHDKEGLFIWGVRNQKIPHELKTKRPRSQIRTDVAQLREWDERANRFLDLREDGRQRWDCRQRCVPKFRLGL